MSSLVVSREAFLNAMAVSHGEVAVSTMIEKYLSVEHYDAVSVANAVPVMLPKSSVEKEILAAQISLKSSAFLNCRRLASIGGLLAGVCTALFLAGIMTTPVGWAIGAGLVLAAIAGAIYFGGIKEALKVAAHGIKSFVFGLGIAAAGIPGWLLPSMRVAAAIGGLATYLSGNKLISYVDLNQALIVVQTVESAYSRRDRDNRAAQAPQPPQPAANPDASMEGQTEGKSRQGIPGGAPVW